MVKAKIIEPLGNPNSNLNFHVDEIRKRAFG